MFVTALFAGLECLLEALLNDLVFGCFGKPIPECLTEQFGFGPLEEFLGTFVDVCIPQVRIERTDRIIDSA